MRKILSNLLLGISVLVFIMSWYLPVENVIYMINNNVLSIWALILNLFLWVFLSLLSLGVFVIAAKIID